MLGTGIYIAFRQVHNNRQSQQQIAQSAASLMDDWFLELDNALTVATQHAGLMDLPQETQAFHLRQVMTQNPAIFGVALIDARPGNRGNVLVRLGGTVTLEPGEPAETQWFESAITMGRYLAWQRHPETKLPIVLIAQVVQEGNQAVGLMVAEAHLGWLDGLLRLLKFEQGDAYLYVIDSEGRPILHEQRPLIFDDQTRTDIEGIAAAIRGEAMPYVYTGLNTAPEGLDQLVVGAYQPLREIPWVVIAEQPLPWVIRGLTPLGIAAAVTLILSLAVAVLFGWRISRLVARPIMLLRQGARRIGDGELDHRITLQGKNELVELAKEFNQMAADLQESQASIESWGHELEDKVSERTRELGQALEQLQEQSQVRETLLRTIQEMGSPVIPLMQGVILIPLIGALDSERAQSVTESLLAGIEEQHSQVVIIDVTGLAMVDTAVARVLLHASQSARLLGAHCIMVGIGPEVAATMVHLGLDLDMGNFRTAATLQEGMMLAQRLLRR